MPQEQNQVLGRGKLYFDPFMTGTLTRTGELYLGNTPALSITTTQETLDHFNSDEGLRVKDKSVRLQQDRSGKFTTDNISVENLALMFGTDVAAESQDADSTSEIFTALAGRWFQLGTSDDLPLGVRNATVIMVTDETAAFASGTLTFGGQPSADDTVTIAGHAITFKASGATGAQVNIGGSATLTAQALKTYINTNSSTLGVTAAGSGTVLTLTANAAGTSGNSITLAKSGTYPSVSGANMSGGVAGTTYVLDTDYEVDLEAARVFVAPDAGITDGDTIKVWYSTPAEERQVLLDDGNEVAGSLRFISANPEGKQANYLWPYVKLTADGDYNLKGDEWQTISFNFEVLQKPGKKRTYIQRPAA